MTNIHSRKSRQESTLGLMATQRQLTQRKIEATQCAIPKDPSTQRNCVTENHTTKQKCPSKSKHRESATEHTDCKILLKH
jgi:hypothetical protein